MMHPKGVQGDQANLVPAVLLLWGADTYPVGDPGLYLNLTRQPRHQRCQRCYGRCDSFSARCALPCLYLARYLRSAEGAAGLIEALPVSGSTILPCGRPAFGWESGPRRYRSSAEPARASASVKLMISRQATEAALRRQWPDVPRWLCCFVSFVSFAV